MNGGSLFKVARFVYKFGGTSVSDTARMKRCAARVASAIADGHEVAVVVSAMGHTTDELIDLAKQVGHEPDARELDALMATGEQVSAALFAMTLQGMGVLARSLTGAQAGVSTDGHFGRARVQSLQPELLVEMLAAKVTPVVAGFQGRAMQDDVATLGRGGSDTTAVAIGAALRVGEQGGSCEIFTDVDGVYTADPRIVPDAVRLATISYGEMLELASLGAGVMHPRAVVFGEKHNVPIHIRHSQHSGIGTMVMKETPEMEDNVVVGCALKSDLGRITLRKLPIEHGVQATLFDRLASGGVIVDDIIQSEFGENASVAFTVEHQDLGLVKTLMQQVIDQLGQGEVSIDVGLAKVSAVGVGMRSHAGVAARMFRSLSDVGIRIHNINTSEIKISCIVDRDEAQRALRTIHDAFGLTDIRPVAPRAMQVPA
ncbi:MAG: aspartate kinase [Planctomycetota bacterium]|nr:aspartate kinase [Planctomycetota bacterium]